jgi:pimeloyl-ACP methyl ester carboxylesterase
MEESLEVETDVALHWELGEMSPDMVKGTQLRTRSRKILLSVLRILLGVYVAALVLLYLFEDRLIFPAPDQIPTLTPAVAGLAYEDLYIPVDETTKIHAWWIPASEPTSKVMLYFHGNAYSLESEAEQEAPLFHRLGVNLLLADYRGYGKSSAVHANGPRTEADARAAWRYLVEQRRLAPSDIVIAGWSIGSAVATQLAVESPHAAGLILMSPISSVNDAADEIWFMRYVFRPVRWFGGKNDFDTRARISKVRIPVLILSGTADDIAQPWMPQAIYDRANEPKTLRMFQGVGHNDFLMPGDGTMERYLRAFLANPAAQGHK